MKIKSSWIIGILVIFVLIFGAILLYTFVIQPAISGYATSNYNQGASDAITVILNQVSERGFVEIPLSDSETIVLAPVQQ